jgi:hypothetical protein
MCPTCDLNAMASPVIITFVVGLFFLVLASAYYWWVLAPDMAWKDRWEVYVYVVEAIVAVVTLVALVLGILLTRINESAVVSQSAITTIQTLLNDNYPYSLRIARGYRPFDAYCSAARSSNQFSVSAVESLRVPCDDPADKPTRLERKRQPPKGDVAGGTGCAASGGTKKRVDKARRATFESVALDIVFQSIEDTLSVDAIPSPAFVHMLAVLFDNVLVRNGWRAKRVYYALSTQAYVSRTLFPAARRARTRARTTERAPACGCLCGARVACCYACTWSNALHPTAIVGILSAILLVLGSAGFWLLWVDPKASAPERWTVYLEMLAAFVAVPTFFLLVYAFIESQKQADFVNVLGFEGIEIQLYTSYPESVRYYKQLYPFDAFVARIALPPTAIVDVNKQELFEATFSDSLLQSIEIALLTKTVQSTGDMAAWRSNFRSPILRCRYALRFYNWMLQTRQFIQRELWR